MLRRVILAAAFLFCTGARAELNLPRLAETADRYRTQIISSRPTADAIAILREVRRAESAGDKVQAIRGYEKLVALGPDNVRSWLQLGAALRAGDPRDEKALASAYNAYRAGRVLPPAQVDALLLLSSVLRARLTQWREAYEDARERMARADRTLTYHKDPDNTEIDTSLVGESVQTLERARSEGARLGLEASAKIVEVVADLDEVYREIAAIVPGVDVNRMQIHDGRNKVLAPVLGKPERGRDGEIIEPVRVAYQIRGGDVRACISFTQDLLESGLAYKKSGLSVEALKDEEVGDDPSGAKETPFGVETKANALCLTGLEPGSPYKVTLGEAFASRGGSHLEKSFEVEIKLPDLPPQIAFAGRRYILPSSGPGAIPLQATNLDTLDLELFRISDRALHRHIALGHVGGEMPYREYADLRDRFAERIWSGGITVRADSKKANEPTRISLKARALLEQRRAWLAREIRDPRGSPSPKAPLTDVADGPVEVAGQFHSGAIPFEAANFDRPSPGVYALVTSDLSRKSDDDDSSSRSAEDCTDKKTTEGRNTCERFLVQWFVETDLGLAFYEGETTFSVVARSFRSGEAKAGARIELIGVGNRVLASGTTNAFGIAEFPINLTRGSASNALIAVLAHKEDDFGFLAFGRERLDLSRLNVDGRPALAGLNAFLTSERGLYQAGETVNLLGLLRDAEGRVPQNVPRMIARLELRDRVLWQERIEPDAWKLGGAMIAVPLPATARSGQARITLTLGDGENATLLAEREIQVGPVRPDRARLSFLQPGVAWARKTAPGMVDVQGALRAQYLYGHPSSTAALVKDAKAEVVVRIRPAETPIPGCFPSFVFGTTDEKASALSIRQFIEYVDLEGSLKLSLSGIPMVEAPRPMAATVEVTLFDSVGPLASRSETFPVQDDAGWLGISNQPRLRPGQTAGTYRVGFDLAWNRGESGGEALDFELMREREYYIWERLAQKQRGEATTWQHVRAVDPQLVAKGRFDGRKLARTRSQTSGADGRQCPDVVTTSELDRDLEVGRYLLKLVDRATGRSTELRFGVGTSSTDPSQLEPNIFILSADKPTYRPGETITLTAEIPYESGQVLVGLAAGDVRDWFQATARDGKATISVPVRPEWTGKSLYALATAYRSGADGSAATGPSRAIGALPIEVRGADSGYSVALRVVGEAGERRPLGATILGPDEPFTIEVCIATTTGCASNPPAEAYAALYVVDEGLLGLTGQGEAQADPERHFYGRKRLSLRVMDNYDRLLLKEGGDRPTRLALSNYVSRRIVSLFQRPIKLEKGRATVSFPKIDLRNGSAIVQAVVWSADYAATRSETMVVRSPIVADLDMPGYLLAGDRAILPLRLENRDFDITGEMTVRVTAAGGLKGVALSSSAERFDELARSAEFRMPLSQDDPARTLYIAIEAEAGEPRQAQLGIVLEAPTSRVPLRGRSQDWAVDVRSLQVPTVETISFPLSRQAKALLPLASGIVEAYRPGTAAISFSFSSRPTVVLSAVAAAAAENAGSGAEPVTLEHLIWRGMRLLYDQARNPREHSADITRIVSQIQALQISNGSYVPYRTGGDFAEGEAFFSFGQTGGQDERAEGILRATSALDFLVQAKAAGHEVSERGLRAARLFVQSRLASRDNCTFESAYAWLVLVDYAPSTVGWSDIDKLGKCSFSDLQGVSAAAAVLSKFGLRDRAETLLEQDEMLKEPEKLADLEDHALAIALTFLGEAGAPQESLDAVANALLRLDKRAALSGSAAAWVLRGANRTAKAPARTSGRPEIVLEGIPANLLRPRRDDVVETQPIPWTRFRSMSARAAAAGDGQARGSIVVEGHLAKPNEAQHLPPTALKRRYFDLATGQERDIGRNRLRLGERVVVVVEGHASALEKAGYQNGQSDALVVADLLPSAFQIVSADVFGSRTFALTGALAKLGPRGKLRSADARSDRWVGMIIPEAGRAAGTPEEGGEPPGKPEASGARKGPPEPEFRAAYLVRVGLAGRFAVPPLLLEATRPPIRTLQTAASTLDVGPPSPGDR